MISYADALRIAHEYVDHEPPFAPGYRHVVGEPRAIQSGWYFDFQIENVAGLPPEQWERFGGAPGFVVLRETGDIRLVPWGSEMPSLQFRCSKREIGGSEIAILRRLTGLSISDIRKRASDGLPMIEVRAFEGDWQGIRVKLADMVRGIEAGEYPLVATEVYCGSAEQLDSSRLRGLLRHLREIELETQMHTQLEIGEIADPSEFRPYDKDWT